MVKQVVSIGEVDFIRHPEENCTWIWSHGIRKSNLTIGKNTAKIMDSYIYNTTEIVAIVKYIELYFEDIDCLMIQRSPKELCGEIILHKWLYKLHIKRAQTKDCDLNFDEDPRWYVNLLSSIIGIFVKY